MARPIGSQSRPAAAAPPVSEHRRAAGNIEGPRQHSHARTSDDAEPAPPRQSLRLAAFPSRPGRVQRPIQAARPDRDAGGGASSAGAGSRRKWGGGRGRWLTARLSVAWRPLEGGATRALGEWVGGVKGPGRAGGFGTGQVQRPGLEGGARGGSERGWGSGRDCWSCEG